MKLCLVSAAFYPAEIYGGPINSTLNVCRGLSKKGIDVRVSTTDANGRNSLKVIKNKPILFENLFYIKYYSEEIRHYFSFRLLFGLRYDIKNSDIIYIQAIYSYTTPIALFYSKIFKKPIILAPRGSLSNWAQNQNSFVKKIWYNYLIKPFVKNITWHATSEYEMLDIINRNPGANVFNIPNGISLSQYAVFERSNLNFYLKYNELINSESKIIVSLGRIHKVKGFDILIESLAIILKTIPNTYLFIAGDDAGEKENLCNLINQYGLEHKIKFVGNISGYDKVQFLGNADVFTLASHSENFGIVYAEALASGTPIVASNKTPWHDVENYGCGYCVDNTKEAFAENIMKVLLGDRAKYRESAKKYIVKFEWEFIIEQLISKFKNR